MHTQRNKRIVPTARMLRKNMTKEERRLWYDFLSLYSIRFTRQKVLGKYIADFYCGAAKLVIELDGSQHYSEKGENYDKERTQYLKDNFGITVIRISNLDIMNNFYGVCTYVDCLVRKMLQEIRL